MLEIEQKGQNYRICLHGNFNSEGWIPINSPILMFADFGLNQDFCINGMRFLRNTIQEKETIWKWGYSSFLGHVWRNQPTNAEYYIWLITLIIIYLFLFLGGFLFRRRAERLHKFLLVSIIFYYLFILVKYI